MNIQREDLNPIDEAKSTQNIINLRGMTQEEFATKFGKSRSYVTNLLGLLKLPSKVQTMLINKEITASHARALSKIEDEDKCEELALKIVKDNLNVRDIENIVSGKDIPKRKEIKRVEKNPMYQMYENIISDKIGNKVRIKKNKMEISFDSTKDLERIMEILNISIGED